MALTGTHAVGDTGHVGDHNSLDTQLAALQSSVTNLAPVATTGQASSLQGSVLEFQWNPSTLQYELLGNVAGTAAALVLTGHRKVFSGPSTNHPKNIVAPVVPVFTYGDRFEKIS